MTKSFQTLKGNIAKGSQKISKATVKAIVNAGEFEKIALGYRYDGREVTKDTLIENPIEWFNGKYDSLSTYINNSKENIVIITLTVHSNLWYYLYVDISKTYEGTEYLVPIQEAQLADELEKKAEQDAYDKKVQERENAYASNVTTEGIENFKSVNVENKEIYVIALQPSLNKNDWKTDNDQEIDKDSNSIKCKVTDIVYLSKVDYDYFSFNMLTNYSFLEGDKGGTWTNDETGIVEYNAVVCIYCEDQEPILVDPSGYSYARYANRLVKDLDGKLAQETQSELIVNDNLFIETLEKINNTDLYIFYKGKLWNYLEKRVLKDERFIYNKYDSITAITGLSFREMLATGDGVELNIKPIHFSLETFIEGIVKFEMGIVKVMFGASKKSEIDEIVFSERLSRELTRASNVPNPENPITQVVKQYHEETEVITEDPYKQPDIEDGYIYNIHFKAWEKTIEEIEAELTKREIPFTNMGDKVGCYSLNINQAKQVKNISDINGSICFIDSKEPSKEVIEQEQSKAPTEFIQASKRQLYALYIGTKIKTTDLVISKEKAGELISKSIKGINITKELQAFINGDTSITEVSEPLPDVEEIEQEEEIKIMENFDDILSKFDDIEVKNSSRISPDDQTFCEDQERNYNEFIKFSNDYLGYLKENSLSNIFYNSESLINEMNKTRDCKKDDFISKVVSYFKNKYKVTLDSKSVQKKYDTNINHDTIVNEIIEQLGGYNFVDKAEKEIKDEFKNELRHDKIKIKNVKISIDDFFYIDSFDLKYKSYSVSYGSDEKFYKLFKAMSHFIYKSSENFFNELYEVITRKNNDDVFRTHDIFNNDIIKTLKIYKNGKIDLEFSSAEHMRKFAKEYCGYVGM